MAAGIRFELNDGITEALNLPVVRSAIDAVADGALADAATIADALGYPEYARGLRRLDGIRPGAKAVQHYRRPYARVEASAENASALEYGDHGVSRAAILLRATAGALS